MEGASCYREGGEIKKYFELELGYWCSPKKDLTETSSREACILEARADTECLGGFVLFKGYDTNECGCCNTDPYTLVSHEGRMYSDPAAAIDGRADTAFILDASTDRDKVDNLASNQWW